MGIRIEAWISYPHPEQQEKFSKYHPEDRRYLNTNQREEQRTSKVATPGKLGEESGRSKYHPTHYICKAVYRIGEVIVSSPRRFLTPIFTTPSSRFTKCLLVHTISRTYGCWDAYAGRALSLKFEQLAEGFSPRSSQGADSLYSPSCREGIISETQREEGDEERAEA